MEANKISVKDNEGREYAQIIGGRRILATGKAPCPGCDGGCPECDPAQPAPETKFKVGDRVRCRRPGHGADRMIGTITKVVAKSRHYEFQDERADDGTYGLAGEDDLELLPQFQPGDIVRLKCGGPKMVVSRLPFPDRPYPPGHVRCMWFARNRDSLNQDFPVEVLVAEPAVEVSPIRTDELERMILADRLRRTEAGMRALTLNDGSEPCTPAKVEITDAEPKGDLMSPRIFQLGMWVRSHEPYTMGLVGFIEGLEKTEGDRRGHLVNGGGFPKHVIHPNYLEILHDREPVSLAQMAMLQKSETESPAEPTPAQAQRGYEFL